MSEEADDGAGLVVMEDEQIGDEKKVIRIWEWSSPVGEWSTAITTGDESTNGCMPVREVGKEGSGLSELSGSPLGSFHSLHSSQSSEKDKMIHYAPLSEEVKVLQFEDTWSETDCRNFNLIYESLLLEGRAGNLTDLIMGIVLAEKPPAWLHIIHGRLKHLIISSEAFQKKKKAEYNVQAKTKQTVKEREWKNTQKEVGI